MMEDQITGTLGIGELGWWWKPTKKISMKDLEFLNRVNPSSSVTFLKHLSGAEQCKPFVRDREKFLKCLTGMAKI